MTPYISYLVTCKNDGYALQPLLDLLYKYNTDAECVILDDNSDDVDTLSVLKNASENSFFRVEKHSLNKNYGEHKNYGKSLCKGKYIFQIDSDELPTEYLLENLKEILESNPDVELFWIPRINDFSGVTEEHAKRWQWRLSDYENRKIVNWPDRQTRIFKNLDHIKWEKKLHERVVGAKIYGSLPDDFMFSLIHTKTIEKQEKTNEMYNREFSISENMGG